MDKSRIVSAQVWVKDIFRDFDAINAVWAAWVPQGRVPARATVEANLRYENKLRSGAKKSFS
ncbi:Rid family hydrolase [Pseudomonas fluorescens]|uniref:Rid family hydrolase n=1 Tax=Pseudomonas fluorescens TaxID=294 RepID=UPI00203533C0|nr:Rid family hydrolase [Pseudomonas fluorescens]